MRPSPLLDTQAIDAIQWSEPEAGTLAYRYPMLDMEIQTGAQLTVRESEMAVFVDEGRIADVFGPGVHALNAANLPVLSGMKSWAEGFESPFKADIYFFSTRGETGQRWGTATPLLLRDTEFGEIRVRGYGSYSYRIADVRSFFNRVCGTRESYFVYDLDDRLRKIIAARLEDFVVASGRSELDLEQNPTELSEAVMGWIRPVFATLGLELMQFAIQSVIDKAQSAEGAMDCGCCGASLRADRGVLKCDYCHTVVVSDAGDDVIAEFEGHACPECEIPLLQATVGGASLLYCTRCDGMLVGTGEFESLVAASRALAGGTGPVQAANGVGLQHSIACPECRQALGVSFYGDVAIESCEDCGLNWLDHTELARIAHAPASEADASGHYFNAVRAGSPAGLNIGG